MKVIDVKDQVRLPLGKCVELVLSGIKYRLFRSAITVTIIALAVAFLMTMLTESLVSQRVADELDARTAPRRLLLFWVGRIASPLTEKQLTEELAKAEPGDPRWLEFKVWGGMDDTMLGKLTTVASEQTKYLGFFGEDIKEGERRPLVGRARGTEIFELLQDEQAYANFEKQFRHLGRQMHTDLETFRKLLAEWDATRSDREVILKGHADALKALKATLGEQDAKTVFAHSDETLLTAMGSQGFQLPVEDLEVVRREASFALDAERLSRLLKTGLVKRRLADKKNADLPDVNAQMFFSVLGSRGGADWFVKLLQELSDRIAEIEKLAPQFPREREEVAELEKQADALEMKVKQRKREADALTESKAGEDAIDDAKQKLVAARDELKVFMDGAKGPDGKKIPGLNKKKEQLQRNQNDAQMLFPVKVTIEYFLPLRDRIRLVADSRLEQSHLSEVQASIGQSAGSGEGFLGFSSRTMWLIFVSFLVCVVGIANAMLMSVTDRFREIATMKCLGATDGYIMVNFVLESCLQGTAGGIVGAMLGFLLGALRSWAGYGGMAIEHIPVGSVLAIAGFSFVVGMILSALAAMYPAWIAARLAPMEAMRIE